jgi:5,10-methylene-tetrahydrofolate dehydrogenase/methenyl tetrahydrofolate cyclohydrolase
MPALLLESKPLVNDLIYGVDGMPGYRDEAAAFYAMAGAQPVLISAATDPSNAGIADYRLSMRKKFPLIGVQLDERNYSTEAELIEDVQATNIQGAYGGTLVKVPFKNRDYEDEACAAVADYRDVDGMSCRRDSVRYRAVTPTAMRRLLEHALGVESLRDAHDLRIAVIGATGKAVGRHLMRDLQEDFGLDPLAVTHHNRDKVDRFLPEFHAIFAATGFESLQPEHVSPGTIIIDAGVRKVVEDGQLKIRGDVHPSIYDMDGVTVTPVRGGVGSLTATIMGGNTVHAAMDQYTQQLVAA